MSFCSNCGRKQNRKRNIDPTTKICDDCTNLISSSQQQIDNVENNSDMNTYYNNYIQSLRTSTNTLADEDDVILSDELLCKPISELTVRDILKVNIISNKPFADKLDTFVTETNKKVSNLDKRIEILEAENIKKDKDNSILKEIVTNMQKCLNRSDSETRNKNIIILGLPKIKLYLKVAN